MFQALWNHADPFRDALDIDIDGKDIKIQAVHHNAKTGLRADPWKM